MDIGNLLKLIIWAAVFGVAVIYGTRILGGLAGKVKV